MVAHPLGACLLVIWRRRSVRAEPGPFVNAAEDNQRKDAGGKMFVAHNGGVAKSPSLGGPVADNPATPGALPFLFIH